MCATYLPSSDYASCALLASAVAGWQNVSVLVCVLIYLNVCAVVAAVVHVRMGLSENGVGWGDGIMNR